ncbi:hypothetical protein OG897_02600 [Streptomyces sp. NBC_00237]|uniref:hypothetical protein n=1 Tax=Streptomyces sp. NBC_00237 TaxID=2975687 RepID=UPI0022543BD5|nr:hypothetical protein [Streptomyces sp. NBC_00237]MCX5200355.1 hypothetical protein [Streptomyces sp. NBC_00237]
MGVLVPALVEGGGALVGLRPENGQLPEHPATFAELVTNSSEVVPMHQEPLTRFANNSR